MWGYLLESGPWVIFLHRGPEVLLWCYLLGSGSPRDPGPKGLYQGVAAPSGTDPGCYVRESGPSGETLGRTLAKARGRCQNRVRGGGKKTCPKGGPGGPSGDFLNGLWGGVLPEGAKMNIAGV